MKGGKQSAMNVSLQPFPQCASDQLLQKIYNLVCDYLLLQRHSPKGMRTQWRSPYLHHKKQNLSQFYRKSELIILTVMKHKNPNSRSRSPELTFRKHVKRQIPPGEFTVHVLERRPNKSCHSGKVEGGDGQHGQGTVASGSLQPYLLHTAQRPAGVNTVNFQLLHKDKTMEVNVYLWIF